MKIILMLAFAAVSVFSAVARSLPFLDFPADARSAAMGNAGYVSLSNPFATHYNTAAIVSSDARAAAGVSFVSWQPDMFGYKMWNAGGYYKPGKRLAFAAGVSLSKEGAYDVMDDMGNRVDRFSPKGRSFDLGAAYGVTDRFAVAATLRGIFSNKDGMHKANAFAADLDLFYRFDAVRLGVGVFNIGSKLDYGSYGSVKLTDKLPAMAKLGVSVDLLKGNADVVAGLSPVRKGIKDSFVINADGGYYLDSEGGAVGRVGAEYTIRGLFAIRGGYVFADKEKVGESYGTIGFGVNLWDFSLDYSYILGSSDSFVKKSMLVSVIWRLGR